MRLILEFGLDPGRVRGEQTAQQPSFAVAIVAHFRGQAGSVRPFRSGRRARPTQRGRSSPHGKMPRGIRDIVKAVGIVGHGRRPVGAAPDPRAGRSMPTRFPDAGDVPPTRATWSRSIQHLLAGLPRSGGDGARHDCGTRASPRPRLTTPIDREACAPGQPGETARRPGWLLLPRHHAAVSAGCRTTRNKSLAGSLGPSSLTSATAIEPTCDVRRCRGMIRKTNVTSRFAMT